MYVNDNNEDTRDLIQAMDEDGNEITLEVLDYLFYNGEEYAVLEEAEEECDMACEGCAHAEECQAEEDEEDDEDVGLFVCKVVSGVDEDGTEMDEFSQVEDVELAEKIIAIFSQKMKEEEEADEE